MIISNTILVYVRVSTAVSTGVNDEMQRFQDVGASFPIKTNGN